MIARRGRHRPGQPLATRRGGRRRGTCNWAWPEPMRAGGAHRVSSAPQENPNAPIAVPWVLRGQLASPSPQERRVRRADMRSLRSIARRTARSDSCSSQCVKTRPRRARWVKVLFVCKLFISNHKKTLRVSPSNFVRKASRARPSRPNDAIYIDRISTVIRCDLCSRRRRLVGSDRRTRRSAAWRTTRPSGSGPSTLCRYPLGRRCVLGDKWMANSVMAQR
jgi:hypothetical protein